MFNTSHSTGLSLRIHIYKISIFSLGYCFLLFQEEISVQALIDACLADDGKFYWCVTSPTMKDKPVSMRTDWMLIQFFERHNKTHLLVYYDVVVEYVVNSADSYID